MRRPDLQLLAKAKIDDARLLVAHHRAGNAYYLAGYAVELGLKACIARQVLAEVIPDRRFLSAVYDHDLERLVIAADLADRFAERRRSDPLFAASWVNVRGWSPTSRYQDATIEQAREMVLAVGDPERGVLKWIQIFW